MRYLITILAIVFMPMMLTAADLNFDSKTVDAAKLLQYPTLPSNPDKIGDKDCNKVASKFTIKHVGKMGGGGGVFADIMVRGLTNASSGYSGDYLVSARYMNWDTSATLICREVNAKMLSDTDKKKLIEDTKAKFDAAERFEIVMSYPSRWGADADLSNWNVIVYDDKGVRYSPVNIENISLVTDAAIVGRQDTNKTYVVNQYMISFPKLADEKTKIELILAGGATEDKKLGFRWIFTGLENKIPLISPPLNPPKESAE